MQRWILARLRDGQFATLAAVDAAVGDLLDDLNTRPFKRLPGSRQSAYAQLDRPALKALPVSRYEFARYHEARVNIDYQIAIDEHFYSVPQALVHQKVEARATARSIEVLTKGRVTVYSRRRNVLNEKFGYIVDVERQRYAGKHAHIRSGVTRR